MGLSDCCTRFGSTGFRHLGQHLLRRWVQHLQRKKRQVLWHRYARFWPETVLFLRLGVSHEAPAFGNLASTSCGIESSTCGRNACCNVNGRDIEDHDGCFYELEHSSKPPALGRRGQHLFRRRVQHLQSGHDAKMLDGNSGIGVVAALPTFGTVIKHHWVHQDEQPIRHSVSFHDAAGFAVVATGCAMQHTACCWIHPPQDVAS